MIRISVCDDEQIFRNQIKEYILKFQNESTSFFNVNIYENGNDLLNNMTNETDIIFLDIKMEKLDGITTAKKIRQFNELIQIIFVTSAEEYALEGYKVNAFDYIVKPVTYKRISIVLSRVMKRIKSIEEEFLIIRNNEDWFKIDINTIIYIETLNRKLLLHTTSGNYFSNKKMKELEKELTNTNFFRCNSGYIVNFKYINKLVKNDIFLPNNEIIQVSRSRKGPLISSLTEFWGEKL